MIQLAAERRIPQGVVFTRCGASAWAEPTPDQTSGAGLAAKRGRLSQRRIAEEAKARFTALVQSHDHDFGPTLAAEYLVQRHGFRYSVETPHQWMSEAGL
ncbi:Integrase catalytic region [mine drainage metagenome]|uniref:Integrase catalytic region n=1 Tax=mine drainage metagenome TaxID=410659 RepID=T1AGK8_9ZZZZ